MGTAALSSKETAIGLASDRKITPMAVRESPSDSILARLGISGFAVVLATMFACLGFVFNEIWSSNRFMVAQEAINKQVAIHQAKLEIISEAQIRAMEQRQEINENLNQTRAQILKSITEFSVQLVSRADFENHLDRLQKRIDALESKLSTQTERSRNAPPQ